MKITYEQIKAKQYELQAMLDAFKSQRTPRTIYFSKQNVHLARGEFYVGVIVNDGLPSYHLILLPDDKYDLNWEAAKAWAAEVCGELPNRREQALLYANLKDQFQSACYWSSEQHASNSYYAWSQHFGYGVHTTSLKSSELRVRAVRRVGVV